jgi:hypothetical protein
MAGEASEPIDRTGAGARNLEVGHHSFPDDSRLWEPVQCQKDSRDATEAVLCRGSSCKPVSGLSCNLLRECAPNLRGTTRCPVV